MSDFNVDDCLREWRSTYGKQQSGKTHGTVYWKIDIKERRYALKELIKVLRANGLERERLETSDFIASYLRILFGEAPWPNREKQKSAFAAAKSEYTDVISEVFRTSSNFEPVEAPAPPKPVEQPVQAQKKFGRDPNPEFVNSLPAEENVQDVEFAKFLGVDPNE